MPPTIRPRDAASLLLLKKGARGPSVLMGRRPPSSSFIPDAFVFPGGKVDRQDREIPCPLPLASTTARALQSGASTTANAARALANAAIRETYEETGLLVAQKTAFQPGPGGTWHDFEARGLCPDLSALRLIGRAITPSVSPVRYHARFFAADAAHARGRIQSNQELLDLAWYPIEEALGLPIIDVTRFMLEETLRWGRSNAGWNGRQPRRRLFVRYRREIPIVGYEGSRLTRA